jgi:homocysteine S-methyltransferase
MSVFEAFLQSQGFVVLDGGLATELENTGENLRNPLWSAKILLSAPQKIADVHYAYFLAGADVAITCSYQATFPGLQATGLSARQAGEVIRLSVAMANEARERFWSNPQNRVGRLRPLVAASIGPYGAFLHDGSEYRGDYGVSCNQLKAFHSGRFAVLADSGVDLLACETIPSLLEAQALVELAGEASSVPAWISFSCRDESHISDGSNFSAAIANVCQSPNIVAAGLNCTAPRFVNSLLEQARLVTKKPLIAYPNSGEIYDIATSGWASAGEIGMIEQAAGGWRERGALLIGGCCRTTPATIRAIRGVLSGPPAHAESN